LDDSVWEALKQKKNDTFHRKILKAMKYGLDQHRYLHVFSKCIQNTYVVIYDSYQYIKFNSMK